MEISAFIGGIVFVGVAFGIYMFVKRQMKKK